MIFRESAPRLFANRMPMAASVLLALGLTIPATNAQAQGMVQAVPPKEARDLSEALGRLARNPRDLSALIAAGNASLQVDDIDAAIGFFGRADDLSPNDARVKAGLAGAYVRSGRALDALRLFGEAQILGGSSGAMAADRGLAYDLIGAPDRAQEEYARALAYRRSDEVLRRLALSQAISGDRRKFENTLRPLLSQRDFASYRVRAFGLAILGEGKDATEIAEAVMPAEMATRMGPYLQLMPRLSSAQQAAAANLGKFPTAGDVGRDDPQFAAFRAQSGGNSLARAEQRLAPRGPALGSQGARSQPRAQADSGGVRRRPGQAVDSAATRRAARRAASDPLERASQSRRAVVAAAPPPPPPPSPAPLESVEQSAEQPAVPVASSELPAVIVQASEPVQVEPPVQVTTSAPPVNGETDAATGTSLPQPGFDLANVSPIANTTQPEPAPSPEPSEPEAGAAPAVVPEPAPAPEPVPEPTPQPAPPPATVADAFGSFAAPAPASTAPAADAVDITAIEPPRDRAREMDEPPVAEPVADPAPPASPSRVWVQVATGRDRSALKFDWRRFVRAASDTLDGNGPFVATWGQTNRLLAGPFANAREARRAVAALKEAGVDSFAFTSANGQEIEELR